MKKNGLLKIAAVVFAITILTTCLISGTFAKFTSTAEGTGSANVAKWSFTVDGTDIAKSDTFTIAMGTDKLAPGITIDATQIAIANASDVEVAITVTPSAISLLKDGTAQTSTEIADLDKYLAKFALVGTLANSGANLAAAGNTTYDLALTWTNTDTAEENAVDTAMGVIFADGSTYTLSFTVTITATQVVV